MFEFIPIDAAQEIEEIDENIRKLQNRADLLRRICQPLSVERLTSLHERFTQIHREFSSALEIFNVESASLFEDLAQALGYVSGGDFYEWMSVRGESGRLFRIAQCISEEFCTDTRRGLYYEARKELEMMFLELKGCNPPCDWFECLLREEGQISYDEKMPPVF
ncbi:MAG: hypothetical protein JO295_04135 [Verrucomicrobia bacterium]|nr:hypothetical protein [Verrucomicrobiota bacterium]